MNHYSKDRSYGITIKDTDRLILKTGAASIPAYLANRESYVDKYDKLMRKDAESVTKRLNFLLDHFSDCINLYEGQRDEHGNLKKFKKLEYDANDGHKSKEVECPE